ncbi:MAG: hypothetical protein LUD14_08300 [Clostridiales bacterium]|nr:hypothetical protein [Clostridiales bacterium]
MTRAGTGSSLTAAIAGITLPAARESDAGISTVYTASGRPTGEGGELSDSIKSAEQRLAEIAALKKHIINYSRTKETYAAYRKSGYSKKFLEEHREEITLHKAAKAAFNQIDGADTRRKSKIHTIRQLNQEYAQVLSGKKAAYAEYREARKQMQDYLIARKNIEAILGVEQEQEAQRQQQERQKKSER